MKNTLNPCACNENTSPAQTSSVVYDGQPVDCIPISVGDNLSDIIKAIGDRVCDAVTGYTQKVTAGGGLPADPGLGDVHIMDSGQVFQWNGTAWTPNGEIKSGEAFKVRLGDSQVSVSGGQTVVSDSRLIGKSDYPVSSSQLQNAVFRDSEITYSPGSGSFTISGFELQPDEVLVIYSASEGGGGSADPLLERVEKLEAMMAPILAGGGRWLWTGPIDQIPPGWEIDHDWNGRVVVAYDPSDPDFNQIGLTGGSKTHKLTVNQLPKHSFFVANDDESVGNSALTAGNTVERAHRGTQPMANRYDLIGSAKAANVGRTNEVGNDEEFSLMMRYGVGIWIKYVGV